MRAYFLRIQYSNVINAYFLLKALRILFEMGFNEDFQLITDLAHPL